MFGEKRKGMVQVIGALIAVLVALIILVRVVIPTVAQATTDANISDPATVAILGLFTLLLAVAGVIFIVKWLM
jgi:uncharacterized membrane protein YozB (DUF420 family)